MEGAGGVGGGGPWPPAAQACGDPWSGHSICWVRAGAHPPWTSHSPWDRPVRDRRGEGRVPPGPGPGPGIGSPPQTPVPRPTLLAPGDPFPEWKSRMCHQGAPSESQPPSLRTAWGPPAPPPSPDRPRGQEDMTFL